MMINKIDKLFILVAFTIACIVSFGRGLSFRDEIAACTFLIILLGIPHGAIDHILFIQSKKSNPILFYASYLGVMLVYVLIWICFPVFSLIIFLVISAYHFGQSQMVEKMGTKDGWINKSLYFSWGSTLLSSLFSFNHDGLIALLDLYEDTRIFIPLFDHNNLNLIFTSSLGLTLFLLAKLYLSKELTARELFYELIILSTILAAFYLLPLIIGFTIYFVFQHSLKVMIQEYNFLKNSESMFSVRKFVLSIAPFSLMTIFFLVILLVLYRFGQLPVSVSLLVFIFISTFTIPHSFVMESFYSSKIRKIVE